MPEPSQPVRILVKLRPTSALRAAEGRANLRPLYSDVVGRGSPSDADVAERGGPADAFAAAGSDAEGTADPAAWYFADLPDADAVANPWDLAHARVADQLGVAESDVLFAEPDLVHDIYRDPSERDPSQRFELLANCIPKPQDDANGKAMGPDEFGWHLGDDFSQLRAARAAVEFTDPRTRIAHLDTGYWRPHVTVPQHVREDLERNFVERDGAPGTAQDPDNDRLVLDNSGHGTGTLSILAGAPCPASNGQPMGAAPDADIVPLRVADSVVLLKTSAFARALRYATDAGCDVVSMSMGGLPSRSWKEAVDRAYLRGVVVVTAAGNNFGGLPTRNLVYPARYARVIAALGVMADRRPYTHLEHREMEGNYGPDSRMTTAIAAFTPNLPWALYGCDDDIRHNGAGTSSATPQVAGAAALWLEKYKGRLPRDWRRVEAVRHALFSAAKAPGNAEKLGRGILRAADALAVQPVLGLPQTESGSDWFAFLRVLTGLGLAAPTPRERMFNLELAQLWLLSPDLQEVVPDPEATGALDEKTLKKAMEAVIESPRASLALRRHMARRYTTVVGTAPPRTPKAEHVVPEDAPVCDTQPQPSDPSHRRLRIYAADPSFSTRLDTAALNEVTLSIRWEALEPGPVGEYLEVEDVDASGKRHDPVDLNDPRLLARDGWAPAEGNPQFHQQMVYAVAMKTIAHFEHALGRPVLWRPRPVPGRPHDDSRFVQRLAVRPHALRQANAFYSPNEVALKFGYFEAGEDAGLVPGSRVYTSLSHDIIAHETTHAILDGMYRRFGEPTNPDVLALHEAFADIVALMQHFTLPELLEAEIGRTRGDLEAESALGSLAVQFGRATGGRGALREAIGRVEDGRWRRLEPDPRELRRRLTPHSRGAILVAAVFDAFLAIYKARTADLLRIYTGGTGVLPAGAIHPDLVTRLAGEASKSARHVLTMCIRALDYLPPVDVTFFEYLRALITADYDLVSDDRHNYRVAFVEAFRRRGIYPVNLSSPSPDTPRTLSVDTLRWQGVDRSALTKKAQKEIETQYGVVVDELRRYAESCFYLKDRKTLFDETRKRRQALHGHLAKAFEAVPAFAEELGIDADAPFEVHALRRAMRVGPDGGQTPQAVVALTQSKRVEADEGSGTPAFTFHGGSTVLVDLAAPDVKYRIIKNIESEHRQARTAAFVRETGADPLRRLFFAMDRPGREPFAVLHALGDGGGQV